MTNLPSDLPARLRKHGLHVVEVDGWRDRGRPASTGGFAPVGVLCHHTATSKATSDQAVIQLLINGRSDLPGPLVQLGLNRVGTTFVIAAGRCNHAGVAKPSGTVAGGDGNVLYIGIEAFNAGTGEPWPQAQYDAYVKLCAALCVEITGNSFKTVRGHKETSVTGKIDPAGPTPDGPTFDMDKFRSRVAAAIKAMTAPPPKPTPPPTPPVKHGPPITVVHASGKASKPAATGAQLTAALDAYLAAGADVITLTEVSGIAMVAALAAWADANKFHLYHPSNAGQRECAILSRLPLTAVKAQPLTEVALPNGRAPLALVSARVKGGPWVAVWHSPAHTEGLKPGNPATRIYRAALLRLRVARMRLRGGGLVIAADWNLDLRRTTVRAQLAKPYPHMKWAWAPGQKATEGGRVIDGVLTNLEVAKPAVTLPAQPGFDHKAISVVLRKKGKA